jgi:septal ring factor EnvC (AmiA/AmiB activator)
MSELPKVHFKEGRGVACGRKEFAAARPWVDHVDCLRCLRRVAARSDEASKRASKAESGVKALTDGLEAMADEATSLRADLAALTAERDRLREALEWTVELLGEIDDDNSAGNKCRKDYRTFAARALLTKETP